MPLTPCLADTRVENISTITMDLEMIRTYYVTAGSYPAAFILDRMATRSQDHHTHPPGQQPRPSNSARSRVATRHDNDVAALMQAINFDCY